LAATFPLIGDGAAAVVANAAIIPSNKMRWSNLFFMMGVLLTLKELRVPFGSAGSMVAHKEQYVKQN
jgi:hypothetical protein